LWKEDGIYVIKEAIIGVTTQGDTFEEALANLKEAITLYMDEVPEAKDLITKATAVGALSVEVP
jgi:predicted RNase H-like HicB family nuclease